MTDFIYTIDPTVDSPVMLLQGEVGEVVIGEQFARELYTLDTLGKTSIKVLINSTGGSVVDGMAIYDAINQAKTPVITYNVGVALSIAAVIFLAAKERIMSDYARLMYHNPWNPDGSEDEGLDQLRKSLIKMIAKDSGKDKEIEEIMNRETWMDPQEALEYGFATSIKTTTEKTKTTIDSKKEILAKYNYANFIMNKFIQEENKSDKMRKTTKTKAELQEEILEGLQEMEETIEEMEEEVVETMAPKNEAEMEAEDSYDEAEAGCDEMEAEDSDEMEAMDEAEAEDEMEAEDYKNAYIKLKNEMEILASELKTLRSEKAKMEAEAEDAKIMAMLNGYVKAGRIKGDEKTISDWKASAKRDFAFTERLIKGLPVTKAAVKIDQNVSAKKTIESDSIALKMLELQNKIGRK